MDTEVRQIELDRISTEGCQTRDGLHASAVAEYAELLEGGVDMEPGVLFGDGQKLHLAAGHHRLAAYRRAGRDRMPCVVKQGTQWDAIEYGIRDNLKHRGERMTNADKAHTIRLVLRKKPEYSDGMIAEVCGATPKTAARYRAELEATMEIPELSSRIGKDGRTRSAANLGTKPPASPAPEAPERASGVESSPDSTLDTEHHSCGGRWVSDGDGRRFCEACRADHPEGGGLRPEEDESLGTAPKPVDQAKAARKFDEVTRGLGHLKKDVDDLAEICPGPDYQRMMGHLDKADDVLARWREAEVEECCQPTETPRKPR